MISASFSNPLLPQEESSPLDGLVLPTLSISSGTGSGAGSSRRQPRTIQAGELPEVLTQFLAGRVSGERNTLLRDHSVPVKTLQPKTLLESSPQDCCAELKKACASFGELQRYLPTFVGVAAGRMVLPSEEGVSQTLQRVHAAIAIDGLAPVFAKLNPYLKGALAGSIKSGVEALFSADKEDRQSLVRFLNKNSGELGDFATTRMSYGWRQGGQSHQAEFCGIYKAQLLACRATLGLLRLLDSGNKQGLITEAQVGRAMDQYLRKKFQ